MQIYEKAICLVKSESMSEAENNKTYAIFDQAANRKFIKDLQNINADIILFPPIKSEKVNLDESANESIENLKSFDWLIFSDVLAVEYFLEILEEKNFDLYELDDLRVCALGEAVSDRLRFASIHADVIPPKYEVESTFSALSEYIGESEIGNLRFLFVTSEKNRIKLTEKLQTEKSEVTELPIYRLAVDERGEITKLKTLLKGGAIDEFVLCAPTDLVALEYFFKSETLSEVFAEIAIGATDGVMFQTAREHDLRGVGLFHLDKVDKVNK